MLATHLLEAKQKLQFEPDREVRRALRAYEERHHGVEGGGQERRGDAWTIASATIVKAEVIENRETFDTSAPHFREKLK